MRPLTEKDWPVELSFYSVQEQTRVGIMEKHNAHLHAAQ
jgi:hypothetical protein